MIAHPAPHLDLEDPRNWRTRTSIHVRLGETAIQVDAGQEFRMQCLRFGIDRVDTVILTHGHADHILGMDDLRRFCDLRGGEALPVFSTAEGLERVRSIYPYAILDQARIPGYPAFKLATMPSTLEVPGGTIQSFLLPHGAIEVLGLVFHEHHTGSRFAYFTDCSEIPQDARNAARGADAVVLDGLRPKPHPSHMHIAKALEVATDIGCPRTFLTHMTAHVDHATTEAGFPENVRLAYDGLHLTLTGPGQRSQVGGR